MADHGECAPGRMVEAMLDCQRRDRAHRLTFLEPPAGVGISVSTAAQLALSVKSASLTSRDHYASRPDVIYGHRVLTTTSEKCPTTMLEIFAGPLPGFDESDDLQAARYVCRRT